MLIMLSSNGITSAFLTFPVVTVMYRFSTSSFVTVSSVGSGVPVNTRLRSLDDRVLSLDRTLLVPLLSLRDRVLLPLMPSRPSMPSMPLRDSGVPLMGRSLVTMHVRRIGLLMGMATYRKTQVTVFVLKKNAAIMKTKWTRRMDMFRRTSMVPVMLVILWLHAGCSNGSCVGPDGMGWFLCRVRMQY